MLGSVTSRVAQPVGVQGAYRNAKPKSTMWPTDFRYHAVTVMEALGTNVSLGLLKRSKIERSRHRFISSCNQPLN
jgi:hypothetical protein